MLIGGSVGFSCLSRTGVGFGGSVGAARLNVAQNQNTLSLRAPHGIPDPGRVLKIDAAAIAGVDLAYGVPLSFAAYAQKSMLVLADGINPLRCYLGGVLGYPLGIVAPKAAPTALSVATDNRVRPIANLCGTGACADSPADPNNFYCAPGWYDSTGTAHDLVTDPSGYICNAYQAVAELTTDDIGRISYQGNTSGGRSRLKFSAPAFTPTVDTGHSVLFRLKRSVYGNPVGSGYTMSLIVSLMQGTSTTIKTQTYAYGDLTDWFKDYTWNLSEAEAALITDYTNLRLVIELDQSVASASNYYVVECSYVTMTLPTTGGGFPSGSYEYVYTYVRSATGVESGPSPILTHEHTTDGCVEVSDLLLSDDPDVDFINIYRTVNGGETFYLVDTIANSNDSTFELGGGTEGALSPTLYADGIIDCTDDVTLALSSALNVAQKRVYGSGLPPRVRFLRTHLDRVWGAGALLDATYSAGSATFTNGSTTVTGTGTHWTDRIVGRSVKASSAPDSQKYTVAKVVSETEMILKTAFDESTATAVAYSVRDDNRNPNTVYWSYPGYPEDWPVTNGLTIEGEDNEGITGLAVLLGRLVVFRRDAIYAVSGNSEANFQVDLVYRGVGCVDGHTIVETGNAVFFRDADGWYAFDGQGAPQPISSPDIADGNVVGIDRDADRFNAAKAKWACAMYVEKDRTVRTWCALDGDFESNHAVVLDTSMRSWMIDTAPGVSACAAVLDEDEEKVHLVGTIDGCLFQIERGLSDGVFGGTIVASVTSSTHQVITCSAANFDTTDGLTACPIYLVDQYGKALRLRAQRNTATQINLLFPLPFIPDSTYTVCVGAVPWTLRSGHWHYGNPHKPTVLQYQEISFTPQTQGRIYMRAASNFRNLQILDDEIDLTDHAGYGRVNVRHKARHIQWEMLALVPGYEIEVSNLEQFALVEPSENA